MTIEYELVAPGPTEHEGLTVSAPARTEFSAERYGPVCTRDATEAPSVNIIHNRRKFGAGKMTQKIGGKGRHEVLIMFNNEGDTGLKDVTLKDVIPENFEIKDWLIRGNGEKREDCQMTREQAEDGTHLAWNIPLVGKDEEIMISFEITGPGAIDGELGNIFHGVHFGDEDESIDAPAPVKENIKPENKTYPYDFFYNNCATKIKDEVKEVANGYECGMALENYDDIRVNDVIEAYILEDVYRSTYNIFSLNGLRTPFSYTDILTQFT